MSHKSEQVIDGRHPQGEGVLVTGCSSGIGRATAIYLAKRGFTVFATVRRERDAEGLRQLHEPNLIPTCPLDLTRLEDIPPVRDSIAHELRRRGKTGLYAIINNAGAGAVAPIELMSLDAFRTELHARILGPVALMQTFLPLLREACGRILWIVTPALLPIPYVSSIHACDFAVNCIARTANLELGSWAIPNVLIRCGGIKTAAPARNAHELAEAFTQWPSDRLQLYRAALSRNQAALARFDEGRTAPEQVARVVFQALCARKPKRSYMVGHMAWFAALIEALPQPIVDFILERRF